MIHLGSSECFLIVGPFSLPYPWFVTDVQLRDTGKDFVSLFFKRILIINIASFHVGVLKCWPLSTYFMSAP